MFYRGFRAKEGKILVWGLTVILIAVIFFIQENYYNSKHFREQTVNAENLLSAGDYKQAVQAYKSALSDKNHDEELTIGLANAYAGLEEYDKALEVLRASYKVKPSKRLCGEIEAISQKKTEYEYSQYISRAEVYHANKEYKKAITAYEKAKGIKSKEVTPYQRITAAYIAMQEYELAREEAAKGQAITKDESFSLLLELIDADILQEEYDKLIDQGREYTYHENYNKAINQYKQAMELKPEDITAYKEIAQVYMTMEVYGEAARILGKALALEQDKELDNLLAQAEEQLAQQEEVTVTAFQQAAP
ncbi:MAG TPA: tetratricopeptide repeat protein [Clostridiales bacterium]|nr:tetratricopeptide repeat protein [Clostridiales bacterium]